MRLNQLGLLRYGHFTNHVLEFPRPAPGTPDLHVIYGPNEAGKSTLFSGWLDVVFGIPARTGYNFLHDNRALRLEASLDTPLGPLAVARVKGNANTLLDAATDSALPDTTLAAAMGGLDRDGYMTMFSLDDDTLELGGKSILDSKGELGSLLFAASAGLAELSAELSALHENSAQWFKPKGRAHALAGHKARLAELTSQRKAADLAVSDWRRLVQAVEQAQEGYENARMRHAETKARLDALRRDLDALPLLVRLRKAEARLASLPAPRPLPPDWAATLPDWLAQEAELAALIPAAQDQIASLQAALASLPPDDAASPHIPRLEEVEGRFGAVAKECADLPRRRAELAEIERAQIAALARLGRADLTVEAATIAPDLAAELTKMIEAETRLASRLNSATLELARAQTAVQDMPASAPLDEGALARLLPLVAELRRADLLRACAEADAAQNTAQAAQAQAFARLAPWQGDGLALAALDVPDAETLHVLENALAQAQDTARTAAQDCARLEDSTARLQADCDTPAPVGAQQAQASRAARQAAWATHKAQLCAQSAAEFEAAMAADDAVQAARLEQARREEKLALLRQEMASLAQAQARRARARTDLAAQEGQLAQHWAALGIAPEGRSLPDLRAWLARREAALQADHDLAQASAQAQAQATRLDNAAGSLRAALAALGSAVAGQDYPLLLAEAEALLSTAETLRQSARARRDLAARMAEVQAAQAEQAAWQAKWQELCARTWIGTPAPDAARMRATLAVLAELAVLAPQAEALHRRIARIEEDLASFHGDMKALAKALDLDAGEDALALWPRLRARLRDAQSRATERVRLERDITQSRAHLHTLTQRRARLDTATAPLRAEFPDTSLRGIEHHLAEMAQARDLAADCDSLRADLAQHLRGLRLEDELARLENFDPAPAQAEAETLKATLGAQEDALRAAYAVLASAQQARDGAGADGAAARLEAERQTLVLQIAQEAQDFMARQAGMLAVEQALRLYRDTHRSGMMARASAAFALLTGGRYEGLSTQPEGRHEILIAQACGGAGKPVDSLSKGTRFQLYLALRAAGYLELARTRPAVPFIADDIMETFDDTRSAAAFRLLAEMAQSGQVIYLTHHAHLCEIAKRACPDVQLHRLGG